MYGVLAQDPITAAMVFWWFVEVAAVMGLAYLGGRLLAPSQPELEGEIEGGQSRLWNPRTTQKEGGARPRSYGKNLHHGNIVAKWTDVDGNDREVLYLIVEHGDGPTKGVVAPIADNVFLNDQPANNLTAVALQERLGTMNQTVMTGFEKQKLEEKHDVELVYGTPVTITTPNDFFDDIEWTLYWPNGIFKRYEDGGWTTGYITLKVSISEHDEEDWTVLFNDVISVKTMEPYFKKQVASVLEFECVRGKQYDIKFENLSPQKDKLIRTVLLRTVREVVNIAFTRPGRALVGVRAIATARLSGSLDVKVIREDRIINTWNGSTWTLQYSNNRAWVAWDAASLPAIDGDGDGEPYVIVRYDGIDPQYLDLEFFYAWAQFCAEEIADGYGDVEARCACNTIVDEFTNIYSLVSKIGVVGRANIYWKGHQLTGWIDDVVTTPIDLVTMDSMMSKTWKNGWVIAEELMGVAEVFYKDEKLGYERTSAEWASEDAGGFRNIVSFEGVGIITRGAAVHYANYLLERNHLIRNKNRFRVHKDGFRYKLGDVIRLQCRIANWGSAFRVVSSTADTITVDRDVTAEVSAGDVIHIRTYDTALKIVVTDTYEVDSAVGKVITATENWDVTPVKGNLVAVGPAGAIKLRRITELTPTVDNYFNVEVETYDVVLFDADNLDPACPNTNYIWPGPVSDITPPITKEEVLDLISQHLPPQPNIEVPTISSVEWTGDEIDTVAWDPPDADNPITVSFRGETYEITAGDTTDEFIYWDPAVATTAFQTTNLVTTATAAGRWYACRNVEGVAYPVPSFIGANIGVLLAGYLRVGTADIEDLSVTTLKIADRAVTIPVSAHTAGSIAIGTSEVTIQSLSFETTGGTLFISWSAILRRPGLLADLYITIYRDAVKIYDSGQLELISINMPVAGSIEDAPSADTYTYYVKVKRVGGNNYTAINRFLYIHELKK